MTFKTVLYTLLWASCVSFLSAQQLSKIRSYEEGFSEYGKEKLYQDKRGFLWLAESNGFHRWDGKEWVKIQLFENEALDNSGVMSVLETREGIYFFACGSNGLVIHDPASNYSNQIKSIMVEGREVPISAMDVVDTRDYRLLVSTVQGFVAMDDKGSVISFDEPGEKYADQNISGHNPNGIRKGYLDSDTGIYYFGGNAGLFARHINQDSIIHFPMTFYNADLPDLKGNHQIQDIWQDGDMLLCTTWGGGVAVFNKKKKTWQDYRFQENPGSSVTISSLKVKENEFLISQIYQDTGRSGINLFQYDMPFLTPLMNESLIPFEYANALEKDGNNQIWVGEKTAVTCYSYNDLPLINNPTSIYVYAAETGNRAFSSTLGIFDGQEMQLEPGDDELAISYRVINALDYSNLKYEYRYDQVGGEAGPWMNAGKNETIKLNTKSTHKAVFQLRCISPHTGSYIYSGPITLKKRAINLNSGYTWALILLVTGSLVLLSILLISWVNRRKVHRIESQLKILALRSQMNPHFLFNCLNSIRYFIVKNENLQAKKYLGKFSKLLRLTLENSDKAVVSIQEEISMISLYLEMEKLRFEEKFSYEIDTSAIKDPKSTKIPPMIIQPFVENALIHGIKHLDGKGYIKILMRSDDQDLIISISDNGVGRKQAEKLKEREVLLEKTSLATKITAERIELLKTARNHKIAIIDLKNAEGQPSGTEVQITLPLH